jgi:hypothetical protein
MVGSYFVFLYIVESPPFTCSRRVTLRKTFLRSEVRPRRAESFHNHNQSLQLAAVPGARM